LRILKDAHILTLVLFAQPYKFLPLRKAVVPVLFHISGVSPTLEERRYFYRIIDMRRFLDGHSLS
jgi:hypothetical protein